MTHKARITIGTVLLLLLTVLSHAGARTPIRLVTYGAEDPLLFGKYERIAEAFNNAHPEYELIVELLPYDGYPEKVTVMIAGGAPPDVFQAWAQHKPEWAEHGLLYDVTDWWNRSPVAKEARLYPFMVEAAMYGEKIYGVPHDYNARILILNEDRILETGMAPPDDDWSMTDWQTYVRRMTDETRRLFGSDISGHWSTVNWQWATLFNGQGWLNPQRTDTVVDGPEMIQLLEMWHELIYVHRAVPAPGQSAAHGRYDGGYGMFDGWISTAFALEELATFEWRLSPFPIGPGGGDSFAQGHLWSIPVNAPNPEASWKVLEWFLTQEGQEAWVAHMNTQPISNDPALWELYFSRLSPQKREHVEAFIDTLYGKNRIHNMSYWPTYGQVNTIMNRHLGTVFSNVQSPANAMSNAASEIRAVLRGE